MQENKQAQKQKFKSKAKVPMGEMYTGNESFHSLIKSSNSVKSYLKEGDNDANYDAKEGCSVNSDEVIEEILHDTRVLQRMMNENF